MRPGVKGTVTSYTGLLGRGLDRGAAAEDDQVRHRHLLAALLRPVEVRCTLLERGEHLRELLGLVDLPVLLRRQAQARAVGAAALVAVTEGRGRRPGGRDQLRHGQTRVEDLALELRDVLVVDQLVVDGRDGILPDLHRGHLGTEQTDVRTHVAMRELVPGACEGVVERVRVLGEALGDLSVDRIPDERDVGGEHHDLVLLALDVRVGNVLGRVLRRPLMGAGRALGQLPLVGEAGR